MKKERSRLKWKESIKIKNMQLFTSYSNSKTIWKTPATVVAYLSKAVAYLSILPV